MSIPKTKADDNVKMMAIPYLCILSMFLSGQVPHRSNWIHLFWNIKDPVLVQTLSYRKKITYNVLLIGFFHKLISMQDVGHNMLHLHIAQQLPLLYIHQLLPITMMLSWTDRQCPFGIDLIDLRLTQVKNKGRKACHTMFTTYTSKRFKGTVW